MVYTAKTQKELLAFLLVITISSVFIGNFSIGQLYFQIIFSLFLIGAMCIKYTFEISNGYLAYQVILLKWSIYKKVVYPNQIVQFTYKRVGWVSKGAIIKVKQGINIRIVGFAPQTVLIDLIDFAEKNDIELSKTKEYVMLEK